MLERQKQIQVEIGLGLALLIAAYKHITIWMWYGFMATLLLGHYILQEWSAVNQMLPYFFLGMICHILPSSRDNLQTPPV